MCCTTEIDVLDVIVGVVIDCTPVLVRDQLSCVCVYVTGECFVCVCLCVREREPGANRNWKRNVPHVRTFLSIVCVCEGGGERERDRHRER